MQWDRQKGFTEGSAGLKAQEVSVEEINSTMGPGGPGPPPQPSGTEPTTGAPRLRAPPGAFSAVTYFT